MVCAVRKPLSLSALSWKVYCTLPACGPRRAWRACGAMTSGTVIGSVGVAGERSFCVPFIR
jgi:hypothetical protein